MKPVVKNYSVLVIGELLSRGLYYIAFIYMARLISVEGLGILSFTQSLVSYFALLATFGLDITGARDAAKGDVASGKLLANILVLKVIFSVVSFLLLLFTVVLINKPLETKSFIIIYGIVLMINILQLDWFFQGLEKMYIISALQSLRALFIVILLFIFVKGAENFLTVAWIFTISPLIVTPLSLYFVKRDNLVTRLVFDFNFSKKLFKESYPVILIHLMALIYYNIDAVMLAFLTNDRSVGIYSAAYKVILLAISLNVFWQYACTPKLSKHPFDKKVFLEYALTNILIGFFFSVAVYIWSKEIILFLYGESYIQSVEILRVLSIVPFSSALAGTFANTLTLWNLQRLQLIATSAGAVSNVALNFLLIPQYSLNGAAIATIAAELLVFFLSFLFLYNRLFKL
ncbi:MAG: flippase [Nitrospirae bacterium YQR-1]